MGQAENMQKRNNKIFALKDAETDLYPINIAHCYRKKHRNVQGGWGGDKGCKQLGMAFSKRQQSHTWHSTQNRCLS